MRLDEDQLWQEYKDGERDRRGLRILDPADDYYCEEPWEKEQREAAKAAAASRVDTDRATRPIE